MWDLGRNGDYFPFGNGDFAYSRALGRKSGGSQIRTPGISSVVERFPSFFHRHSLHSCLGPVQGYSNDAEA